MGRDEPEPSKQEAGRSAQPQPPIPHPPRPNKWFLLVSSLLLFLWLAFLLVMALWY